MTATTLAEQIAEITGALDLGTAGAVKRGRDPRWPYVPIIAHAGPPATTSQIKGLAYTTRGEATTAAQGHLDALRADLAAKLAEPRMRALREHHGLPREIGE